MDALADIKTFQNLAAALLMGFVIGLERGWSKREEGEGKRFAGLRTFMLISLFGGLAAVLYESVGELPLYLSFAALALVLAAVVVRSYNASHNDQGVTTVIAVLIAFSLGVLAGLDHFEVAAASAVVTAVILGMKQPLHRWLQDIERHELDAAFKLLVISVVVLPILPDKGYGPWAALNPYKIWWMVVLISAISFAGYFAIKWTAPGKGVLLTALLGGLASSTAIAVSFARMGKGHKELARLLSVGAAASAAMMLPRILLVSAVLSPTLALTLLPPLAAAGVAGAIMVRWLWPGAPKKPLDLGELGTRSFDFSVPIRFGLLLAVVFLLSEAARSYFGEQGLLLVAAIAGLTDVDAITLAAAHGLGADLSLSVSAGAIYIAATVNTLIKVAIVGGFGGRLMLQPMAMVCAAMLAAAAVAYLMT